MQKVLDSGVFKERYTRKGVSNELKKPLYFESCKRRED
jgi:hypothetical protein